jgi:hypothetical protein
LEGVVPQHALEAADVVAERVEAVRDRRRSARVAALEAEHRLAAVRGIFAVAVFEERMEQPQVRVHCLDGRIAVVPEPLIDRVALRPLEIPAPEKADHVTREARAAGGAA